MLLHPATVHFPIAFLLLAGVGYAWYGWKPHPDHEKWVFRLHGIGLLSLFLALATGLWAQAEPLSREALQVLSLHERLAYVDSWAFSLLWLWAYLRQHRWQAAEKWSFVLAFILALGLMLFGANLGGELVFTHDVGVAPLGK